MANNRGKVWEQAFKQDWIRSFPDSFIFRIPDQKTGYKITSQNPSDFICFADKKLFLIECKSHEGSSIPFSAIPQYERLLKYKNIPDVFPGIVIWYIDKDLVVWVSIESAELIYNSGAKSIGLKHVEDSQYGIIKIPAIKKRIFMSCDYSPLKNLEK